MKAFWKTYLALAVLVGLAAYIHWVDAKKPAGDEKAKDKVFATTKEAVQELTLVNGTDPKIDVTKDAAGWHLTAPIAAQADTTAIDGLLATIESAEVTETIADQPSGLAEYGLEHPRVAVSVKGKDGLQQLQLGDKTPDDIGVYAKYADKSRVFTVPAHIATALAKKPSDLRDRNVLHVKRDGIQSIKVKGANKDLVLVRDEKGDWSFTKPIKTKGARWAVDGLLGNLESLTFDEVRAEDASDLTPYGLNKPTWTAVIEFSDGRTKTLEIGNPTSPSAEPRTPVAPGATDARKFFARDSAHNLVGVISASVVNDLEKADDKLRSRYLLDFPALDVKTIDVISDGKTRKYVRSVTKDASGTDVRKWKQTAPVAKDIETKTIEDLLFDVASTDVEKFVDSPGALASYGLEPPAIRVELTFDNKSPGWFEVGIKDGVAYGRRDDDVAILKLSAKGKDAIVEGFKNKL